MTPEEFVTTVAHLHPRTVRSIARHAVLDVLSLLESLSGRTAVLSRPRVQILEFHHVLDDETESFRGLLRVLARDHCFISYSEAVNRIRTGEIDRPYLGFSFDDGFKSGVIASRLLDEAGVKACFFICPSIIGETDPNLVARFCRDRLEVAAMPFMSWSDVEDLRRRGHEVGSHSMTHANLGNASSDELTQEIGGAREVLLRRFGSADHFAWPFGRHVDFSPAAARAVFDAGHLSCASGERGAHVSGEPRTAELCLRRDDIIARWPIAHVLHFLIANSRASSARSNAWPAGYALS